MTSLDDDDSVLQCIDNRPATRTREDAFIRVSQARRGSLYQAREEYLWALRDCLWNWLSVVDGRLATLIAKDHDRAERRARGRARMPGGVAGVEYAERRREILRKSEGGAR